MKARFISGTTMYTQLQHYLDSLHYRKSEFKIKIFVEGEEGYYIWFVMDETDISALLGFLQRREGFIPIEKDGVLHFIRVDEIKALEISN